MIAVGLGLALALGAAPCDPNAAPPEAALAQLSSELGVPLSSPEPREALASACALAAPAASAAAADGARLQDILSRDEFAQARFGDLRWLGALIGRWLSRLLVSRGVTGFAEVTRLVVLALALALAVAAALRLLSGRRGAGLPAGPTPVSPSGLKPPPEHLLAARAALGSEPREALRQALLALLSSLEARRWARPDRVRTNRELAQELPRRGAPPAVAAQVHGLVQEYDAAFYSLAPVEASRAERFVGEVEALGRQLAREGR